MKLNHDKILSRFAFNFKLRRYSQVAADMERGRDRARDALSRAETRAAAADIAESAAACSICLTHPKDTALNCWCVHGRRPCLSDLPSVFGISRLVF